MWLQMKRVEENLKF